jgi:hypothetical protein
MAAKKMRFPKRELNTWLRKHLSWNHEEWLQLVDELKSKGFNELTSSQEGLDAIGLYLETKKASA